MTKTVLIIEDEVDIRFLLRRTLTTHNFNVIEAENLKQGLELYHQAKPDVIILDINLPDGNGIYYARKFKDVKSKVIFMSADHDKLEGGFKELGAHGFLKKPFMIEQLLEIINTGSKKQSTNC